MITPLPVSPWFLTAQCQSLLHEGRDPSAYGRDSPSPRAIRGLLTKAPQGKLFFIDDDGESVMFKLHHRLSEGKIRRSALVCAMSPRLRATGLAIQRMLEENLYRAVIHLRWIDLDADLVLTREVFFFSGMPAPLRPSCPFWHAEA